MQLSLFPPLNAALNGLSAAFLAAGYLFIRARNKEAHRFCMLGATLTSTVFLACYLYYHFHHGTTRFPGQGWVRGLYFSILLSHTFLAALQVPLIITTLVYAARSEFAKHRLWARWTLPIWIYVSLTGVIIYWMLYRVSYPQALPTW